MVLIACAGDVNKVSERFEFNIPGAIKIFVNDGS